MKPHHFILLSLLSLVFVSCDLNPKSESTPHFDLRAMHIVDGDTTFLNFRGNVMDTIFVGDTITFQTVMYSQFNNLLQYQIVSSREKSIEFQWVDKAALDSLFSSKSDYDKGLFIVQGNFSRLHFPFKYIAKEDEKDLKLTFTILNDASQNYSTTIMTIVTPIKVATIDEGEEENI